MRHYLSHRYVWMIVALAMALFLMACMPVRAAEHNVQTVRAGNMDAWLLEDNSLPIIALEMTINHSGSAYDPANASGLASLTTAMMMEGAGEWDAVRFQEVMDFHAISLRVSAGRDATHLSMQTLAEHKDVAFALLGAMLTQPAFGADDVERVRASHIASVKRMAERPSYQLNRAFYARVFAGHPYAQPLYGTSTSLVDIDVAAMRDWVSRHVLQGALQISVSGDIGAAELSTLLGTHLGNIPNAELVPVVANIALPDVTVRQHVNLSSPQTHLRIALPGVARASDAFYTVYVLNHILGGSGLSSLLGEELRQKRGLTYGAYSSVSMLDGAEWIGMHVTTQNARVAEAKTATLDVLRDVAKNGVSREAFDAAIMYITGAFALNIDSNAERVGYLSVMQRHGLGTDYLQQRNDLIRAVTFDAVNAAAAHYLTPVNPVIMSAGGTTE